MVFFPMLWHSGLLNDLISIRKASSTGKAVLNKIPNASCSVCDRFNRVETQAISIGFQTFCNCNVFCF